MITATAMSKPLAGRSPAVSSLSPALFWPGLFLAVGGCMVSSIYKNTGVCSVKKRGFRYER